MREYPELCDEELKTKVTSIIKNRRRRQILFAPTIVLVVVFPIMLSIFGFTSAEDSLFLAVMLGAFTIYHIYIGAKSHMIDTEEVLEKLGFRSVYHEKMFSDRFHENQQYLREWEIRRMNTNNPNKINPPQF